MHTIQILFSQHQAVYKKAKVANKINVVTAGCDLNIATDIDKTK